MAISIKYENTLRKMINANFKTYTVIQQTFTPQHYLIMVWRLCCHIFIINFFFFRAFSFIKNIVTMSLQRWFTFLKISHRLCKILIQLNKYKATKWNSSWLYCKKLPSLIFRVKSCFVFLKIFVYLFIYPGQQLPSLFELCSMNVLPFL